MTCHHTAGEKLTYCPRTKLLESKDHCMVWAIFDVLEFITEMRRFQIGFTVLEGDEDLFYNQPVSILESRYAQRVSHLSVGEQGECNDKIFPGIEDLAGIETCQRTLYTGKGYVFTLSSPIM